MEGQKKKQSKKFQQFLTDTGSKLKPHDVEILKHQLQLREILPPSVLDVIDSQGKNSGLDLLHELQKEGCLAEDNLELLKDLFQAMERRDLLQKLLKYEKKVKKYEEASTEHGALVGEGVGRPSIFRRFASSISNVWRSMTSRPTITRSVPAQEVTPPIRQSPTRTLASFEVTPPIRKRPTRTRASVEVTPPIRKRPTRTRASVEVIPSPIPVIPTRSRASVKAARPAKGSQDIYADYECFYDTPISERRTGFPASFEVTPPIRKRPTRTLASVEEPSSTDYGIILQDQNVKVEVEGSFQDLSSFGVLLEIPPNAVTRPTAITCVKFSSNLNCPPEEENETLVSYSVRIYSSSVRRLQKPMIVTLKHCGPSKKEGYETIVKAWKEPMTENQWKRIQELQEDTPRAREHFKSGFIEVEIHEWTALAVVTRPITDTFQVTPKRCVVRSSVCNDVTVEFPEGAVDKTYIGAMKLLLMPDYIAILDDIAAYPCPMLLIDGFEGVSFTIPVKIRLPHPYPAGYPTGNVRLLTMDAPHEWKDITDEVHRVENESFIELQVSHFSGLWAWIYEVPLTVASSLSQYLFKVPQDVCFAVFKENEVSSSISLTMTLVCVPNHEQFEKTAALKEEGYTKLASSTGNKEMRPGDKAYTKVEGCYKKKLEDDIFLHFIQNDICRKELPLERKTKKKGKRAVKGRRELVISLLEKKDGDTKDNLCKFCIDETKIVTKLREKEPSPEISKVETVGLESAPPGPSGLCGSEALNRPSMITSASEAASGKELEVCFGDKCIAAIDSNEAASKVANYLKLDKLSLDDPPGDIVVKCRELCSYLKSNERGDIVEKIRKVLPSGMTGPLGDGRLLVKDMNYYTKRRMSRALSAKEEWKAFAQNLGLTADDIAFYDERQKNPVLAILNDHCKNMTVDELYDRIVKSGANAIADRYL